MIKSSEAKELSLKNIKPKANKDQEKLETIEKNIKAACSKGRMYINYVHNVTYDMAKVLIESGYILSTRNYNTIKHNQWNSLILEDFKSAKVKHVKISWEEQ